jgi:hypothetical protein
MTMQKQVIYDRWCVIDTTHGTVAIPHDLVCVGKGKTTSPTASDLAPFIEGAFISCEIIDGWGARLSMPGYMDATEWSVFLTEEQARKHLAHMYDDE